MDVQTIIDIAAFVAAISPIVIYTLVAWLNSKGD